LIQGLVKLLGLDFQRVQFTSDLLPSDIVGSSIYQQDTGAFSFHKGPIFTQVLLADEINRASPKTQSALLEAMGEHQVTADGTTYDLPQPFFVIATQNPLYQSGTFLLPESQLDRFMMRLSLGYPTPEAERLLLASSHLASRLDDIQPLMTLTQLTELQQQVQYVSTSESLLDYLQRIVAYTRDSQEFVAGLSPRAVLSWLHCAKARALIQRRNYVIPEDLQVLMLSVVAHRLLPKEGVGIAKVAMDSLLKQVDVI